MRIPSLTCAHPSREPHQCIWRNQNGIPVFLTKPTQSDSLRTPDPSVAWNLSERDMQPRTSVTQGFDKKAKNSTIGGDVYWIRAFVVVMRFIATNPDGDTDYGCGSIAGSDQHHVPGTGMTNLEKQTTCLDSSIRVLPASARHEIILTWRPQRLR